MEFDPSSWWSVIRSNFRREFVVVVVIVVRQQAMQAQKCGVVDGREPRAAV